MRASALDLRETRSGSAPPEPWRRIAWAAAGGLSLVLVGLVVVSEGWWPAEKDGSGQAGAESPEPPRRPNGDDTHLLASPSLSAAADPAAAAETSEETGALPAGEDIVRADPRDPFAGPLPAAMRPYYRRLLLRRDIGRRGRRALVELQQASPADPRPSLLLAHHFVHREYLSDALERFEQAWRIDPSSRGCRFMLRDLLHILETPSVAPQAEDVIARVYGEEALAAVDESLGRGGEPDMIARLTGLRARIRP